MRDTQGFLLARLRIPLQSEAGLSRPLTAQERRMTAPVVRDVDIVTQTRVVGRRAAQREAAVNPLTGAAINAVEAIDAATTGEAAMRAAVTAAGANSVVVLNGAFAVTDTTTLSTGQTIMGGGTSLQVRGATSGTAATFTAPGAAGGLTGAVAGDAVVTLAPDSTVAGLTIANTSTANGSLGIFGSGADGATVTGTAISTAGGNSDGIHLQDSDNGTVSGNRIETVGTNSHGLVVFGGASTVVSDNVFGPIGGSVLFAGGNPSQTIPTSFKGDSTGNSVTGPVGVIRCFNTGGPVSGTVAFTDGQDCTYP